MNQWFEEYKKILQTGGGSLNLKGAGSASIEQAMEHYAYQHQAKIRGAIEATFPKLMEHMGEEWESCWKSFWDSRPASPRSLDFLPEVFLNYFLLTDHGNHLKDLVCLEQALDIFPWSHPKTVSAGLEGLNEESKISIGHFDVHRFSTPVVSLYSGDDLDKTESDVVIIWQKEDGVRYRKVEEWEIDVLKSLSLGLMKALEKAPEDQEAVSEFFTWLGQSELVIELS